MPLSAKAGKVVLPGSGTVVINGVGFNPGIVIIMTAGSQAEDTWIRQHPYGVAWLSIRDRLSVQMLPMR